MKNPLEFFAERCAAYASKFVPFDFHVEDKNMNCFTSSAAFAEWFGQPPGPERNPYRDRLFYIRELSRVSQEHAPKSILEIGTNIGVGTVILRTLNPEARIVTVDNRSHIPGPDNKTYPVGFLATWNNCGHEQLVTNSATLNPSAFQMVFVDGDHTYEPVLKDSAIALQCVRLNGGGVIVWHDYAPGSIDVMEAVNLFCAAHKLDLQVLPDSGTVWVNI